jgi:hypothetical protein
MSLGTLFNNNKQSDCLILRESMPKSFLRLPQCGDKLKIIVINKSFNLQSRPFLNETDWRITLASHHGSPDPRAYVLC